MTQSSATAAKALDLSGHRGFRTIRVSGDIIRLATPAAALNAAGYLTDGGYDATAARISGQWAVAVR